MAVRTRYLRRFVLTFSAASAVIAGFLIVQKIILAQDTVAFTVTTRESAHNRAGKTGLVLTVVYALRGDGSTVRAQSSSRPGNSGIVTQRKIFDLARGEEVTIDELTESTITIPLRKEAMAFHKHRPANCTSEDAPVHGNMLGYEVVREVESIGGPGRIVRMESWRAPALKCYPLKEYFFLGRTEGDQYLARANEVLEVTIGEPSPALFERPTGYTERSPSQRRIELQKRYPERTLCPSCSMDDAEDDKLYYSRQSDRGK